MTASCPHGGKQGCQGVHVGVIPPVLSQPGLFSTTPEVVLLSAFQAFLVRTNNQEITAVGLQPSTELQNVLPSAAAHEQHLLIVPCPAMDGASTLATHTKSCHEAVATTSAQSTAPFQAVVASDVETAHAGAAASVLGLALLVHSTGSSKVAQLVFKAGSRSQEDAKLTACHLQVFLSKLCLVEGDAKSWVPLLRVPMMDHAEECLVLESFNQSHVPNDPATLVHGMFADNARRHPEAPCLIFNGCVYSYAEVDAAANCIAHYLRNQAGAVPGDMIGVLVLRSPLMVAALLGVLRAGCGYLPLDHHHPEARIDFMVEDATVKTVITQEDLLHKLPSSRGLHILLVQPEKVASAPAPAQPLALPPATISPDLLGAAGSESPDWQLGQLGEPDTPCYIIYTSGSTGKPKGVVVLHKGLTAYTAWFRSHFSITSRDVFIQKTPTNFDASVDELWTSLSAGATLVVAPPEAHRDVHSVMTLITRYGVTTASAVPSQVQVLAREILSSHSSADAAADKAPGASLRRVLSGGEALTTTMAREVAAALPACELHNTYGPTETTVGITSWLYRPPAKESGTDTATCAPATIPIGRGIHNSRLYVLDSYLQPVPVGVPGQLFISGLQVAAGYLNRPDLTNEVFVPNPFCEGPNTHTDKMYRTGDLVRWLPGQHACIEFLGRVDHQVKLRGFRIELQEVEAALGALQGVRQVVTAVVKNPATEQDHLVAWLSPKDLQAHSLVQQLQSSLPEYMCPTVMVLMDQLPLLVSEKVDRKALPAPDFAKDMISLVTAAAATGHVPTGSSSGSSLDSCSIQELDPLSKFVSAVWGEVLDLPPAAALGQNEDFFSLGGNSLLAGKMNSTLRAGLHLPDMSGMLVYQHPSLAAFVAELAHLDPEVPSLPELGMGGDSSSLEGSSYSSYFAAMRNASFSSLGTASSTHNSFSSQQSYGQRSAIHTSESSPSIGAKQGKKTTPFAAFQSASDIPRLATVFSDHEADSASATGLFKQLSRSLSKAMDKQDASLDALPLASVPLAATSAGRGDSFGNKLRRVLSSESLSLRTMLSQTAAGSSSDQLPISNPQASDSTDRPVPFNFDAQRSDQQQKASSRTPSRTNSITSKGVLQIEHLPEDQLQHAPAVKPSLVLATILQLFSMCVVSGVSSMLNLAPMLISMYILLAAGWRALVLLPAFELGSWLLLALWSVGGKWLLVGRYKQAEVPLWGSYYIRHWVAHLFVLSARQSFVPLVRRTLLLNWFYKALGVKVGRNVVIDTDDLLGYDLIELQDDCILDAASGVSAITYEAGKPGGKFSLGTMRLEPVCVGERAVVGPNAMVTPGRVAPDSVVLPCSATSNPPGLWRGSTRPTYGPEGRAAVNTQDPALGIVAGFAAMWITSFLITLLSYPVVVGYWTFFQWLVGSLVEEAASAAAGSAAWDSLQSASNYLSCWVQTDQSAQDAAGTCSYLMRATMLAMLVLPAVIFVSGQLLIVMVVPFKWLLRTHVQPLGTTPAAPKSSWQRFRHHLQQCLLDHPTVKTAAFLWTGTAIFNAWLRALGTKVGKQAWIGEDLHLKHHELVEIGDTVSICSAVTLLPSAAQGAAKISIMGGADVTNQTALYPGVTVKPGAVLGVFTYAEAGRTFPCHSITQGPMVLSPGQPDPATPPPKPSPSKPPKAPTGSSPAPANTPQPATNTTPSPEPSPAAVPGSSAASTPYTAPASTPAKPSPSAAVYRTAIAAAADKPEPSEARLVSWQKYLRFNMLYITLMSVLMPVHTVMLSAPSAVITVLLMFKLNWWAALLLAPAVSGLQTMVTICWMALLKRILLPRCQGSHPFYTYSHTAWMVEGLLLYYQQVSLVRYISGSQLAVWYYRALGAKIGKGVLLNGLHSQEPDCLTIGDGTVIDEMTFIMAHTVENRCLKFHDVVVGSGVTIGCGSCALPGCCIGDGATMGDVSLLMKGEMMPPGSVWKGVPAVPCISGAAAARKMRPPM